ncbi:sphingosine kinase 2 [Octopus bimaculoides]|nr:sphingosine kinase 2 [Octopus bimaculoides]
MVERIINVSLFFLFFCFADHAGHAQKIVQTLDISRWYGIVIVAGDGLIFEVINGLMSRPDWDQALKIPIGCIPGGSGNALCCSINYSAGEPILENMVLHSTFILIKHQVLPLDLVAIQTVNQSMYSFLSVTWGFIADIDYESEKYRKSLGSKRFLFLLAQRLIDLRSYRGRLSFIPITAFKDSTDGEGGNVRKLSRFAFDINPGSRSSLDDSSSMDEGVTWSSSSMSTEGNTCIKRSATMSEGCSVKAKQECSDVGSKNTRHCSETNLSFEESTRSSHRDLSFNSCSDITNSPYLIDDGKENNCDQMEHADSSTFRTANYSDNKAGFPLENNDSIRWKSQQMVTADNVVIQEETLTARKNVGCPVPTPLLPPLHEPLPDNWVVIEDDFVLLSASYQTHLGPDFLSAPDSRFNDGIIHLHFIRTGISRNALFKLFLSVEDGSHLDSPFVESIKVLAFRLEPLDKAGNIMVDGEHIEYGPIQGQVLPGIAKIMGIQ